MFYWGTQKTTRPTHTHTEKDRSGQKAKTSKIHIDIKANHFKIALSSDSHRAQNIKRFLPKEKHGIKNGERERGGAGREKRKLCGSLSNLRPQQEAGSRQVGQG